MGVTLTNAQHWILVNTLLFVISCFLVNTDLCHHRYTHHNAGRERQTHKHAQEKRTNKPADYTFIILNGWQVLSSEEENGLNSNEQQFKERRPPQTGNTHRVTNTQPHDTGRILILPLLTSLKCRLSNRKKAPMLTEQQFKTMLL